MPLSTPPSRLLSITRLLSRAGRGLTGVDRVELAYLQRFLNDPTPVYGLATTSLGHILLDRSGLTQIHDRIASDDWGRPGPLARLHRKLPPVRQAALSRLREAAMARHVRPQALVSRIPETLDSYVVGQSDLDAPVLGALAQKGRLSVLIHDTIPLDYPDWQRPGSVARFQEKLSHAGAHAHRIIVTSDTVAAGVRRHVGTPPALVKAPLGVTLSEGDPSDIPQDLRPTTPYFVMVSTIEPRKNHALLLDVWEQLGPDAPTLVLIGARGWNNDAVFRRLDARPAHVIEASGLSDAAVAALMQNARAFLWPSLAEGYGLPPLETAGRGIPVICAEMEINREILGDYPVYADGHDVYQWLTIIKAYAEQSEERRHTPPPIPSWDAHFKLALSET